MISIIISIAVFFPALESTGSDDRPCLRRTTAEDGRVLAAHWIDKSSSIRFFLEDSVKNDGQSTVGFIFNLPGKRFARTDEAAPADDIAPAGWSAMVAGASARACSRRSPDDCRLVTLSKPRPRDESEIISSVASGDGSRLLVQRKIGNGVFVEMYETGADSLAWRLPSPRSGLLMTGCRMLDRRMVIFFSTAGPYSEAHLAGPGKTITALPLGFSRNGALNCNAAVFTRLSPGIWRITAPQEGMVVELNEAAGIVRKKARFEALPAEMNPVIVPAGAERMALLFGGPEGIRIRFLQCRTGAVIEFTLPRCR